MSRRLQHPRLLPRSYRGSNNRDMNATSDCDFWALDQKTYWKAQLNEMRGGPREWIGHAHGESALSGEMEYRSDNEAVSMACSTSSGAGASVDLADCVCSRHGLNILFAGHRHGGRLFRAARSARSHPDRAHNVVVPSRYQTSEQVRARQSARPLVTRRRDRRGPLRTARTPPPYDPGWMSLFCRRRPWTGDDCRAPSKPATNQDSYHQYGSRLDGYTSPPGIRSVRSFFPKKCRARTGQVLVICR